MKAIVYEIVSDYRPRLSSLVNDNPVPILGPQDASANTSVFALNGKPPKSLQLMSSGETEQCQVDRIIVGSSDGQLHVKQVADHAIAIRIGNVEVHVVLDCIVEHVPTAQVQGEPRW